MRRRALLTTTLGGGAESEIYRNYLTIEALEDGLTASLSVNACQYCIDGSGNWVSLASATATPAINKGQYISFKATAEPTQSSGIGTFTISKNCNVMGDVMSMLYGDDAPNQFAINDKYAFYNLFLNCDTIIDASQIVLKATTLATYCYYYLFGSCKNLLYADFDLPATIMMQRCYSCMFRGCSSLLTAPKELPSMVLADRCYASMFLGCSSLVTAPVLPATTLSTYCYQQMFYNCNSLNYIKALFEDIPNSNCLNKWCFNVASEGTFVKLLGASWDATGESGVPDGWEVRYGVEDYTLIDYVDTNGSQKIDVSLPNNQLIYSSYTINLYAQALETPANNDWILTINKYEDTLSAGIGIFYNGGWKFRINSKYVSFKASSTERLSIAVDGNACSIGAESQVVDSTSGYSTEKITLCYNEGVQGSSLKARIHEMELVGNVYALLYPAERETDGVQGLYDIVNHMFHPLITI